MQKEIAKKLKSVTPLIQSEAFESAILILNEVLDLDATNKRAYLLLAHCEMKVFLKNQEKVIDNTINGQDEQCEKIKNIFNKIFAIDENCIDAKKVILSIF